MRQSYPKDYFQTIKPEVISMIREGKTIKRIAKKYDINTNTLARMMSSANVSAIRIRREQDEGIK